MKNQCENRWLKTTFGVTLFAYSLTYWLELGPDYFPLSPSSSLVVEPVVGPVVVASGGSGWASGGNQWCLPVVGPVVEPVVVAIGGTSGRTRGGTSGG